MRIKTTLMTAAALALAALQPLAQAQTPQTIPADLVTHNGVVIKATPARIWPHIIDLNSWKKGAKVVPLSGDPGKLGTRFKAVAGNPETVAFNIENVEIASAQRRVIRLNGTDGTLIGFAIWQLTPQGGSTLVTYDVYCWSKIATEGTTPAQVTAAKKEYTDANYKRFAEELEGLKKLVEGKS